MIQRNIYLFFSIILFVIAGILAAYTVWSFIYCADTIGQYMATGQLSFRGNEFDIINFYMSTCAQYVVFALLLAAAGLVLLKEQTTLPGRKEISPVKNRENKTDLDEWFSETK